jgi:DNA (cytosine-5)-methyltransferase 1
VSTKRYVRSELALVQKKREFSFVDVFAAPGGLSCGFKMAGFQPLAAIDVDRYGLETFSFNFPDAMSYLIDVQELRGEELLDKIGLARGELDVMGGGPPCQGFSNVGRVKIASLVRKGLWKLKNGNPRMIDDPRNLLYREFIRLVRDVAPKFFVMENVNGMTSYMGGHFLNEIKKEFETAGYTVDYKVLDATSFGVPQHRKRIFFVGNRHKIPNRVLVNLRNSPKYDDPVTVWDSIGDLPKLKAGGGKEIMDYSKDAFHEYQEWARSGSSHVFNHVARPHTTRDIVTFRSMHPGKKWKDLRPEYRDQYGYRDDIFTDKFKRLWKNKPAWTVTAHLCKDGYVYIHPTQCRTITVREASRLQSFPDKFVFRGPRTSQFKQVGNAVPPLMAKALALSIKKALNRFYRTREGS